MRDGNDEGMDQALQKRGQLTANEYISGADAAMALPGTIATGPIPVSPEELIVSGAAEVAVEALGK